jgi:hypothetical protein
MVAAGSYRAPTSVVTVDQIVWLPRDGMNKNMEGFVKTILAVVLAASQMTYYTAKVTTFGCTSTEEVSRLRSLRSDQKAFQTALMEQQMYGQCVTVLKGTVVEGSIETSDTSVLRVNTQTDPPGYEAPLDDFELKADGKLPPSNN